MKYLYSCLFWQPPGSSLFPCLPTFLLFWEFCEGNTAYVVVGSLIRTFFIPRLKSKVWSGNILRIYGHMWSWSFFLFHFCRSGGIPAAAFHAGIMPKFLSRVQLVPLFKSHFIQCYRLTLSSYYWWCRYKSLSHNCAGAISLSHVLSGNSFLASLLFTLPILNQI